MVGLSLALIVGGGLAQVGGVSLIAWEVRATRLRLNAYVQRDQDVEPEVVRLHRIPGTVVVTQHPELPMEERVRQLEQRVTFLGQQLAELPAATKRELLVEVADADSRVERAARRETEALASTMLDLHHEQALARRRWSVVVIIAGIVLAAAGSALSLGA